MEQKQSTPEDILGLIEANKELYLNLPDDQKKALAHLNIDTGTAQSYFLDGKLVACGGIRMIGLGEAWLFVNPENRTRQKKLLMRETKKEIESAVKQGVWCMLATNSISETFLKHLGFKKQTMYVRVK